MDKLLLRSTIEARRREIMALINAQIRNPTWPYLAGTENWLPKPDISLEDVEAIRVEMLTPGCDRDL
jgi:hypothetical protein